MLEVRPMRLKRYCALLLAALLALSAAGCGVTGHAAMSVRPAQLSAEEEALAKLLDVNMDSYRIFDFQMEEGKRNGVQSVQVTLYELEGGAWTVKARSQRAFSDPLGRLALSFGKITDGVHLAVQSENFFDSMSLDMESEADTSSMSYTTSMLTESATMDMDKETPLAIQIVTSKNDITSYGVQYFDMPREYARHNYEHVYAITLMFSQKTVYELADSAANPPASPAA